MRITIIGHTSTGKSTLAKKISQELNIPHLHIDRFWFEAGGNKLPPGESLEKERVREYIEKKVHDFIQQDAWISDGFYPRVQQEITDRADMLIYLDIPLWKRLLNHLERITLGTERHPELSRSDEWMYFPEIIKRHIRTSPKIQGFLDKNPEKLRVLKSRKEVNEFADEVIHRGLML